MMSIIITLLLSSVVVPHASAMSPDPGLERWVEFEDVGANISAEAVDGHPRRGGHSSDWNPYNYARSNPLRYTDPTGNFPEDRHDNAEDRQVASDYAPMLGDTHPPGDAMTGDLLLDPINAAVGAGLACKAAGLKARLWTYPNSKGFGLNILRSTDGGKAKRIIGLDWHQFERGGEMVNLPHVDIPGRGVHHWPW